MNKSVKRCTALFAGLLGLPAVLAYIDPGTGGLVVSSVWSYLAGLVGVIGAFIAFRFIKPLRNHIRNLLRRRKDEKP